MKKLESLSRICKDFANGFMNCVKSSLFWCVTMLSSTALGLPALACVIGIRNGLEDGWSEHDIICRAAFGVTFAFIWGVCEWAIIITEKDGE